MNDQDPPNKPMQPDPQGPEEPKPPPKPKAVIVGCTVVRDLAGVVVYQSLDDATSSR